MVSSQPTGTVPQIDFLAARSLNDGRFNASIRRTLPQENEALPRETPVSSSPPSAFGRFRVVHQVGAGVLGPVFRGYDPDKDRTVAIKSFRLDLTPEQARDLSAELGQLAALGLSHPSVIAPLASGVDRSIAFLVEDYFVAESVDVALKQYGPAPVADGMRLIGHVAGALDYAAALGVHHGCLHPRDILVAPHEVRLTGLGVAAALERVGYRLPVRRPYSAPERSEGGAVGAPADVFSLACVAFELMTGRRPTLAGDLVTVDTEGIPAADAAALVEVCARALSARAEDRHPSALAFAAALRHALTGEPLQPSSEPERPRSRRAAKHVRPGPGDLPLPLDRGADEAAARIRGDVEIDRDLTLGVPEASRDDLPLAAPPEVSPVEMAPDAAIGRPEEPGQASSAEFAIGIGPAADLEAATAGIEPDETQGVQKDVDAEDHEGTAIAAERATAAETMDAIPTTSAGDRSHVMELGEGAAPAESQNDEHAGRTPLPAFLGSYRAPMAVPTEPEVSRSPMPPGDPTPSPTGLPETVSAPASRWSPPAERVDETNVGPTDAGLEPDRLPFPIVLPSSDAGSTARGSMPVASAAPPKPPLPLAALAAAMLLIGILFGFSGGYFVASRSLPKAEPAATSAGGTPAAEFPPVQAPPASPPGPVVAAPGSPPPPSAVAPARPRAAVAGPVSRPSAPTAGRAPVAPKAATPPAREKTRASATKTPRPDAGGARAGNAAPPPPSGKGARPQPARTPTAFEGSLVIESRPPGARVQLDRRVVGVTPLTLKKVPAGSHAVRLELEGFSPWSKAVQVAAGKQQRVTASLDRRPGG